MVDNRHVLQPCVLDLPCTKEENRNISERNVSNTYRWAVNIPVCSLLTVEYLPIEFVTFLIDSVKAKRKHNLLGGLDIRIICRSSLNPSLETRCIMYESTCL